MTLPNLQTKPVVSKNNMPRQCLAYLLTPKKSTKSFKIVVLTRSLCSYNTESIRRPLAKRSSYLGYSIHFATACMWINTFCVSSTNTKGTMLNNANQYTPNAPFLLVEGGPLVYVRVSLTHRYDEIWAVKFHLLSKTCALVDLYRQDTFFQQIARRT